MATTNDLGFVFTFCLATVELGPIARAIWMAIIGFLAVAVLMAVENEDVIYEDIDKDIHDDESNVWL